jgi:hypothetical protein
MNHFCNTLKKPLPSKGRRVKSKNRDIFDQTIHLWRSRAGKSFSKEDAREIITNIAGFFEVLAEWDQKAHSQDRHHKMPLQRQGNGRI